MHLSCTCEFTNGRGLLEDVPFRCWCWCWYCSRLLSCSFTLCRRWWYSEVSNIQESYERGSHIWTCLEEEAGFLAAEEDSGVGIFAAAAHMAASAGVLLTAYAVQGHDFNGSLGTELTRFGAKPTTTQLDFVARSAFVYCAAGSHHWDVLQVKSDVAVVDGGASGWGLAVIPSGIVSHGLASGNIRGG